MALIITVAHGEM